MEVPFRGRKNSCLYSFFWRALAFSKAGSVFCNGERHLPTRNGFSNGLPFVSKISGVFSQSAQNANFFSYAGTAISTPSCRNFSRHASCLNGRFRHGYSSALRPYVTAFAASSTMSTANFVPNYRSFICFRLTASTHFCGR